MKYCPYCGAEILSGAFSFCPSCGESLPVLARPAAEKAPGKPSPQREKAKKERPRKRERPPRKAKQPVPPEVEALDYDGYYEDVQPIDADRQREGVTPGSSCEWCCWWLGWPWSLAGVLPRFFYCESCKQPASSVKYR